MNDFLKETEAQQIMIYFAVTVPISSFVCSCVKNFLFVMFPASLATNIVRVIDASSQLFK